MSRDGPRPMVRRRQRCASRTVGPRRAALRGRRLRLLGKTTTSEFGAVPFTESEALGISRNPWDPDRTPGGSSSGAGVAVAAGMAPIAHGADGGAVDSRACVVQRAGRAESHPRSWSLTTPSRSKDSPQAESSADQSRTLLPHSMCSLAMIPAHGGHRRPPRHRLLGCISMAPPNGLQVGVLSDRLSREYRGSGLQGGRRENTFERSNRWDTMSSTLDLPLPPTEELVAAFTTIWNLGGAGIPLADPDDIEPQIGLYVKRAKRSTPGPTQRV